MEVIKFLLDNGANPNISCEPDSSNALHAAAKWGNTEAVLLLLKNNCHVNKNSFPWDSPLAAAIHEGHSDIVKILLRHGAKVHKYEIVTAKVNKRDDILPILIQQFQYQQASTCTLL